MAIEVIISIVVQSGKLLCALGVLIKKRVHLDTGPEGPELEDW